jgi:hypothetical protein
VSLDELIGVPVITDKLRSDFKVAADTLGPEKAFLAFASEAVRADLDPETEEKFVAIFRAVHDDYVSSQGVR